MKSHHKGAILITAIIMIAIVTLLVLSLMQAILLYFKVLGQVMVRHDAFYRLEVVTNKVQVTYQKGLARACTAKGHYVNDSIALLRNKQGCEFTDGNRVYRFLIEDLGVYPCLPIQVGQKTHSSHHVLVTVLSPEQTLLQIRLAEPITATTCFLPTQQFIQPGVISWRYLP